MSAAIEVTGRTLPETKQVLTKEALAFISDLHRRFNPTRVQLLQRRQERFKQIAAGGKFDFLPETAGGASGVSESFGASCD